jgi:hypothetical protein
MYILFLSNMILINSKQHGPRPLSQIAKGCLCLNSSHQQVTPFAETFPPSLSPALRRVLYWYQVDCKSPETPYAFHGLLLLYLLMRIARVVSSRWQLSRSSALCPSRFKLSEDSAKRAY